MKIGLPKIRLSRKLIFLLLGTTVLFGGTGAAALIFGTESLLGPPVETVIGAECVNIQSVVIRTPSGRHWLRKFVRMDNTDGPTRIKTAMRIAGLLAHGNPVDLVQVVILDTHGPQNRADMRARAIGAEVLFALNPPEVPEMKQPITANYVKGLATPEGRYYGVKVELSLDEIKAMMTAMKDVEDKADCADPVVEGKEGEAKAEGHGKPEGKAKPEGHGATEEAPAHGEEAPAEGHAAEASAEGEHAAPAEGHGDPAAATAEEPSMLSSLMAMVGLGADEPAVAEPAASHEPGILPLLKDGHIAPADKHGAAKTDGHGKASAEAGDTGHGNAEQPAEGHAAEPVAEEEHAAPVADHGTGEADAHDDHTAKGNASDHGKDAEADEAHAAEPAAKGEHPIAGDHHESDQSNAHEGVGIDGHAAAKEEIPQTHSAETSAEDGHQADENPEAGHHPAPVIAGHDDEEPVAETDELPDVAASDDGAHKKPAH